MKLIKDLKENKKTKSTSIVKSEKKETVEKNTKLGTKIKNFKLKMTGDQNFNLSDFKGKKIVLFFYPKDATPGCTQEGHDFSKLKKDFTKLNAVVFGISRDSISSHEKFKSKQEYSVDLISDEQSEVCNTFDVIKDKNMYGKKVRGIERSTFIIDEDGKLLMEWRKVKVEGHAEEVLKFIKSIKTI